FNVIIVQKNQLEVVYEEHIDQCGFYITCSFWDWYFGCKISWRRGRKIACISIRCA
ncbi:MAG: hypothetical protein ACI8W9_001939, partial [Psychromonas sp.]